MTNNQKTFVIVGGGTAGWLTALLLRKNFPENKITLIESSNIGILGAGEGTTPHFPEFLDEVEIDQIDFLKNTKATFKNGIKFTNWHGDGSYYFHPFGEGKFSLDNIPNEVVWHELVENKNFNNISITHLAAKQNKTLVYADDSNNLERLGNHAYHFDARLTAEYFKKVSLTRNVNLVDGEVVEFLQEETGEITGLKLNDGSVVSCNFVFDCTGLHRQIIDKVYKQEWCDYKESLPLNKALPFFIKNDSEVIPPYTEAIAMKYGWVWKIPVQGRYGCGYVFDSRHITDEEAKQEILDVFGDVDMPRPQPFSFSAGCFRNTWVKNCVAIGLSTGFIEPLEATSIWVSIMSLRELFDEYKDSLFDDSCYGEANKIAFNDYVYNLNIQIKDFIQLHYMTERTDTEFWKHYKEKNLISNSVTAIRSSKSLKELQTASKKFDLFTFHVAAGVKYYDSGIFENKISMSPMSKEEVELNLKNYQNTIKLYSDFKFIDHYKLIDHLKQKVT